jgi:signal transduction histidine kinase
VLNGLTAVAYLGAAVAFARLADRHDDALMTWLGVGTAIAAVAFVNYALVPSRFTGLLYGGEVLWIGAVTVLLYGAVREVAKVEAALVRSAVLDERKRVARDLHDGVAQELAFISSQAHWFLRRPDDVQPLTQIMGAVDRALDEARGAIASLNRPLDEPLGVALEQTALGVAERVGARLRVDVDPGTAADVEPEWRDALLRIAREAVGNAVRHGHARTIELRLTSGRGVQAVLAIVDDGDGFDVDAVPSGQSFGLVGMRERTESLGGRFTVRSTPGTGTTVEVELP